MFLHSNYPLQSQVHVYPEELTTLELFLILENAAPTNVCRQGLLQHTVEVEGLGFACWEDTANTVHRKCVTPAFCGESGQLLG